MPRPNFNIEIKGRREHRALVLRGEMDLDTAFRLNDALRAVCAEGAREVVLDLSNLRFIDTTGLRTLLGGHDYCEQHGCKFFLDATLSEQVDRLFAVTGARQHFEFKP